MASGNTGPEVYSPVFTGDISVLSATGRATSGVHLAAHLPGTGGLASPSHGGWRLRQ